VRRSVTNRSYHTLGPAGLDYAKILRTTTKNSHPILSNDHAEGSGTPTSVKVTFESRFPDGSKTNICFLTEIKERERQESRASDFTIRVLGAGSGSCSYFPCTELRLIQCLSDHRPGES
jgi:hypothetical protein